MTESTSGSEFPFRELLGFSVDSGSGTSTARLDVDDRHMNPNGVVHGAVLFALIDTAMGGATMSVVEPGCWCATIDVNIRYLAPCVGGTITATVTVRRAGRRIVHLDATAVGDDGTEYATATGAYAVITPPTG